MRIKSQRDFFSGLMFIGLGTSFGIGAMTYSMGSGARPGPGYFPLILSVMLAILGLVVLFRSLTIETADGDPVGKIAWKPLVTIVVSITVFAIILPRLGLFLAIPILIGMVSFAGDEFHWKGVLISAVVLTIFSWLIFIVGLNLTLPLLPSFMAS